MLARNKGAENWTTAGIPNWDAGILSFLPELLNQNISLQIHYWHILLIYFSLDFSIPIFVNSPKI